MSDYVDMSHADLRGCPDWFVFHSRTPEEIAIAMQELRVHRRSGWQVRSCRRLAGGTVLAVLAKPPRNARHDASAWPARSASTG